MRSEPFDTMRMPTVENHEPGHEHAPHVPRTRWECHCVYPPVLLAIYDAAGRIEIKVRNRYYIAHDRLQATCPRCGRCHHLEIHHQSPTTG